MQLPAKLPASLMLAMTLVVARVGHADDDSLAALTDAVISATPSTHAELRQQRTDALSAAAKRLDMAAGEAVFRGASSKRESAAMISALLASQDAVDGALERLLALRAELVKIEDDSERRYAICRFLEAASHLIDLAGRERYLLRDAIIAALQHVRTDRGARLALIAELIEHRSGIGAGVLVSLLDDEVDDWTKGKVLQLVAVAQESDLLPHVASLVRGERTRPGLLLLAGETVRYVGLPQDPHPAQASDTPAPAITAHELLMRMQTIDPNHLSERGRQRLSELVTWLNKRKEEGVFEDGYRFFGHTVREGDWFLMRNPSPYNMFTDLTPGLFTHVGVVTTDVGDDGVRRFVLVDLPERGEKIPVTNVDAYVLRTLNYVFLRHRDDAAARQMGAAARAMIGNPSLFDLNFRTDRVKQYRGKPLAGTTIHTYCAGFLLLCAQETGRPREEFFPIMEYPAGGRTQVNLKTLGLSLGENFVSPTAAIFSPQLEIVGRRRPMYDPAREIKEAVYDHFARQMNTGTLRTSPSAQQALREKLVQISAGSPWLRRAIAKANGVSDELDLLSAARAAAVVETLDEIADASAAQFDTARTAFRAPPDAELRRRGYSAERRTQIVGIRRQHAELYDRWRSRQITPPALHRRLIEEFSSAGRQQLDDRFFTAP